MRIHKVSSWEITFDDRGRPGVLVYDQSIALDWFAEPGAREMRLVVQERVCVRDRAGYDAAMDGPTCYMCSREISVGGVVRSLGAQGATFVGEVGALHRNRDGRLNGIARVKIMDVGNTRHRVGDLVDCGVITLERVSE